MSRKIRIEYKNKISYNIEKYLKPELVYIPLEDTQGNIYKHLVKEGDYVYKGDIVASNEKLNLHVHSSVSGYAVCGGSKIIGNGKKIKCVIIENDYKEKFRKSIPKKKVNNLYSKEEFLNLLKNSGINNLNDKKTSSDINYEEDNIKYLIINALECEPGLSSSKSLIYNHAEDILETIDKTLDIMNIPKAIIALNENDNKSINVLNKYIGTYPNISIIKVADIYPNEYEDILVKEVLNLDYNKYKEKILISNIQVVYWVYEMLEYNRPITERVITITGKGIKNRKNIKVKIGTLASEVINNIDGYKKLKNPLFIVGGPVTGNSVQTDDVIITKDVNCIMVIEDNFERSLPCIKCGKCMEVCPVKILPNMIMENKDNIKNLNILKPNKCIECGLCSYICPSKIEVRECVREAKEKVDIK